MKLIFVAIGCCILNLVLYHLMTRSFQFEILYDTLMISGDFYSYYSTIIDYISIAFNPLITFFYFRKFGLIESVKDYLGLYLKATLFILFSILIAILIAYFCWSSPQGSLIPETYKMQPSSFYWTLFMIPSYVLFLIKNTLFDKEYDVIDGDL